MSRYPKVAQLRSAAQLSQRLSALGVEIPCDPQLLSADQGSPLAVPIQVGSLTIGNRWCIHPMEGWDAHPDGSPSSLTLRRWQRFGQSGAKLIWGGEAAAVQSDGRANPNQTLATGDNEAGLRALLQTLWQAHTEACGSTEGLVVGLQLTHSGRFCKPNSHKQWQPRIAYHHPLLDARVGIAADDDSCLWSDDDLERLIDNYVAAAQLARRAGFDFVDVKACHGYLLHELLSARTRPGRFGGDLDGRSRVLLTIVDRIRSECPDLSIGVRLSVFDTLPYQPGQDVGQPDNWNWNEPYLFGFGVDPHNPLEIDLSEPIQLIGRLQAAGVGMFNATCGSPYYCPHIQRPAIFPPSDGYQPPEDPLVGVARQIRVTAQIKRAFPELPIVGTGYSYLQEFLPLVAQAIVRAGMADLVGLGRMVLSHPTLPHDTLGGQPPNRKLICRTFSDCTTAPRNGLVSGCYPLDDFYKHLPQREQLQQAKVAQPKP
ncbi:MAG: NADH:flavin oxidoreductase [Pirellulaceae bacterium]|nr:NADH:flavin oxidoreductase [Pirellulaceae bacterium]